MTVVKSSMVFWLDGVGDGVGVTLPGHQVVYREMMSVVTEPMRAGQSVTVAAHEVMV